MNAPRTSASPLPCPLPEGFGELQVHVDRVRVEGVELLRAGLATTGPGGFEVTGAAAGPDGETVGRAGFELLERVATLEGIAARREDRHGLFAESEAPERYRPARSNGIALHATEAEARERAQLELAERDRVLRAWYGETVPERLAFELPSPTVPLRALTALAVGGRYDVQAYAFPDDGRCLASRGVEVVGTFAFPRCGGLPLAMGFAARRARPDALAASVAEAAQSLAFLWDEPVGEEPALPGPSAMHQLEYWQAPSRHATLRAWLAGRHAVHAGALASVTRVAPGSEVVFHDLTPAWAEGFRVARATCRAAVPLVFGVAPWASSLPDELRVQPIA